MPWKAGDEFRDCPWCGLRDAEMNFINRDVEIVTRDGSRARMWTILSCPRCAAPTMFETLGGHGRDIIGAYPQPDAEARVAHLPDDVERYYRNAIRVLEAGVPDAAAVQLRKTLEAAAARHGINKGALVQRIEGLIKNGLITPEFSQVLDHVRQVGNVGAHAGDEHVDEETARRALRFTTQVLRNLFEIPAELKGLSQEGEETTPEEPSSG
jgi:hypothetical protein